MPKKKKRRKSAKVSAVRSSPVDLVISGINTRLKTTTAAVTLLQETSGDKDAAVGYIPSGIWAIDWLVSDLRGLHLGRLMNVWGGTSVGKSALTQFFMKKFQDAGGVNILFDFDDARDPAQLEGYGIDPSDLVIPEVGTIEEGFDALFGALESLYGKVEGARRRKGSKQAKNADHPTLAVWDSVAASPPKSLMEEESAEDHHVASTARSLTDQLKKVRRFCAGRPILPIFVNEQRAVIGGVSFGPQTRQPHAGALEFAMTTILRLYKLKTLKAQVKKRKVVQGRIVGVLAQKSRLGVPERQSSFFLSFDKGETGGPDPVRSNFLFLKEQNLLGSGGSSGFTIRGLKSKVGMFADPFKGDREEFSEVIAEHEESILGLLRDEIGGQVSVQEPDEPEEDPFDDDEEVDDEDE